MADMIVGLSRLGLFWPERLTTPHTLTAQSAELSSMGDRLWLNFTLLERCDIVINMHNIRWIYEAQQQLC